MEKTLRETIKNASSGFIELKAAIFTTFNFNPEFFDNNVLPALFNISINNEINRRNQINHILLHKDVCVFYDANTKPSGHDNYRYQTFGILLKDRFFHSKLIILAGIHSDDNKPWIYLLCGSANLTMTGWGKNCEIIGELEIGSNRQPSFIELKKTLLWLKNHTNTVNKIYAIDSCISIMNQMTGDLRNITTNEYFYFSPLNTKGFLPFLQNNRKSKWNECTILSPYWGELESNIKSINVKKITLVPALYSNGKYGLGKESLYENSIIKLKKLAQRIDDRFWHSKVYMISHDNQIRIGVGSCNFTKAGLLGGDKGNIEAMIVYYYRPDEIDNCIPKLKLLSLDDPQLPDVCFDDSPEHVPFIITVVYDWKTREYSIKFLVIHNNPSCLYIIELPGNLKSNLPNVTEKHILHDERGPLNNSDYKLHYSVNDIPQVFKGLITEVNLEFSNKLYNNSLSLSEILESWHQATSEPFIPDNEDTFSDENNDENSKNNSIDNKEQKDTNTFDVLSLYDMYRSFYEIRNKLDEARKEKDTKTIISYLHTRPDSISRLISLVREKSDESIIKRYLVLLECNELLMIFKKYLQDENIINELQKDLKNIKLKIEEIHSSSSNISLKKTMIWFENEFRRTWR